VASCDTERQRAVIKEICKDLFVNGRKLGALFDEHGVSRWRGYDGVRGDIDFGEKVPTYLDIGASLREKRRAETYPITPCKEEVKGRTHVLPHGLV